MHYLMNDHMITVYYMYYLYWRVRTYCIYVYTAFSSIKSYVYTLNILESMYISMVFSAIESYVYLVHICIVHTYTGEYPHIVFSAIKSFVYTLYTYIYILQSIHYIVWSLVLSDHMFIHCIYWTVGI